MAESTRLKLFQKLIEAYTDAYKEKNGKHVQLEVSVEWMSLDDNVYDNIVYDNIENVPVVKDTFVGTPLLHPKTEIVVNIGNSEDDSE